MTHRDDIISEMNYHNDARTRRMNEGDWYKSIDLSKMTAVVELLDDTGWEIPTTVKITLQVCPMCNGKGTCVNPSIDSNGLTAEDFHDDPDFATDYMAGRFDIPCPECHGRNVSPVIDESYPEGKEAAEALRDYRQADADDHAERMGELRAGA